MMLLSIIAGAVTVLQSRVHGAVGLVVHDGLLVAWISFTVSLVLTAIAVLLVPGLRAAVPRLLAARRRGPDGRRVLPAWQLLGGIGGAVFVTAQGASVPMLGVAVFTIAVVAGQNANSLVVDRLGFGPAGRQPVTVLRVVAAVIATAGVALAVSGQLQAPAFSIGALCLALLAGALVAGQQAVNARVGNVGGTAWAGAIVNFIIGWAVLSVVLGSQLLFFHTTSLPAGWLKPWMLSGGLLGLFFILVATTAVARLGVLAFALLAITGQMVAALLLAVFVPTPGAPVDAALVLGVMITGAAVAIASIEKARENARATQRETAA